MEFFKSSYQNFNKKKWLSIMYYLVVLMMLLYIGFELYGNQVFSNSREDSYPSKPISLVIPYAIGSEYDIDLKTFLPYIEEQLSVPVKIVNNPGNGGWDAWDKLFEAETDGYTVGYLATPTFITGYLNPANHKNITYRDLDVLISHELNSIGIAVRADDNRFEAIDELIEYARQNELTTTSHSTGDASHVAVLKLNQKYITNFIPIHMGGMIQGYDAVINGSVDIIIDDISVLKSAEQNGDIKVLCVLAPERSNVLPEVPTLYESGFGTLDAYTSTGFALPKGVDEAVSEKLKTALEKAMNNPKYLKQMEKRGVEIPVLVDFEYWDYLYSEEKTIQQIINIVYFRG